MSELGVNILINVCIGIFVVVGFIIFLSKYTNIFDEGGAAYEFVKKRKQESAKKKRAVAKTNQTPNEDDNNNNEE